MRTFVTLMALIILSGCAITKDRLAVEESDVAITLVEIDLDASAIPGFPQIDADGCMLILRNAALLADIDLSGLKMETGDCTLGGTED